MRIPLILGALSLCSAGLLIFDQRIGDPVTADICQEDLWLDEYHQFHWKARMAFELQYVCRNSCAGVGDRIRMIVSLLYVSFIQKAHLSIHWINPKSSTLYSSLFHLFLPRAILWNSTDLPKGDHVNLKWGRVNFLYLYHFPESSPLGTRALPPSEPRWQNRGHWGSAGKWAPQNVSSPFQVTGNIRPAPPQFQMLMRKVRFVSPYSPPPEEVQANWDKVQLLLERPYVHRFACPFHFAFTIPPPPLYLATEKALSIFLPDEYSALGRTNPSAAMFSELVDIVMPRSEMSPPPTEGRHQSGLGSRISAAAVWMTQRGIEVKSVVPSKIITLHFRTRQKAEQGYDKYADIWPLLTCGWRLASAIDMTDATFLIVTNNPSFVRKLLNKPRPPEVATFPLERLVVSGTTAKHSDSLGTDRGGMQLKELMADCLLIGSGEGFVAVWSGVDMLASAIWYYDQSKMAAMDMDNRCTLNPVDFIRNKMHN